MRHGLDPGRAARPDGQDLRHHRRQLGPRLRGHEDPHGQGRPRRLHVPQPREGPGRGRGGRGGPGPDRGAGAAAGVGAIAAAGTTATTAGVAALGGGAIAAGSGVIVGAVFLAPILPLILGGAIATYAFGRDEIKKLQYTFGIASFLKDGFEDFIKD